EASIKKGSLKLRGGKRQQINIILSMDISSSMYGKLQELKEAAIAFTENIRENDKVLPMVFNGQKIEPLITSFSSSKDKIVEALNAGLNRNSLSGNTPSYDSIIRATDLLKNREGPKFLFFLTDGQDNISDHSLEEAINYAKDGGVNIYSIGLGGYIKEKVLGMISRETGGVFLTSPTPTELRDSYLELQAKSRRQYELKYTSPIEVSIPKRSVKLVAAIGKNTYSDFREYSLPPVSLEIEETQDVFKPGSINVRGSVKDSRGKMTSGVEISIELLKNNSSIGTGETKTETPGTSEKYNFSYRFPQVESGHYTIEVKVKGKKNLVGRKKIYVDGVKPRIEIEGRLSKETEAKNIIVPLRISDNHSLRRVEIKKSGVKKVFRLEGEEVAGLEPKIELEKGKNEITISATDKAGNSTTEELHITSFQ
ncbi:VWA domain-containing protein, partial [Candidatus Bipolaricaulota bacterium]|nr:VWA domain-containing protein [Candidatus Bipolaricaulota bacterium]